MIVLYRLPIFVFIKGRSKQMREESTTHRQHSWSFLNIRPMSTSSGNVLVSWFLSSDNDCRKNNRQNNSLPSTLRESEYSDYPERNHTSSTATILVHGMIHYPRYIEAIQWFTQWCKSHKYGNDMSMWYRLILFSYSSSPTLITSMYTQTSDNAMIIVALLFGKFLLTLLCMMTIWEIPNERCRRKYLNNKSLLL